MQIIIFHEVYAFSIIQAANLIILTTLKLVKCRSLRRPSTLVRPSVGAAFILYDLKSHDQDFLMLQVNSYTTTHRKFKLRKISAAGGFGSGFRKYLDSNARSDHE